MGCKNNPVVTELSIRKRISAAQKDNWAQKTIYKL